jgi:hypothetical protein
MIFRGRQLTEEATVSVLNGRFPFLLVFSFFLFLWVRNIADGKALWRYSRDFTSFDRMIAVLSQQRSRWGRRPNLSSYVLRTQ